VLERIEKSICSNFFAFLAHVNLLGIYIIILKIERKEVINLHEKNKLFDVLLGILAAVAMVVQVFKESGKDD
jgi:hypothetical protein